MRQLKGITMDMSLSKLQEMVKDGGRLVCLQSMGSRRVGDNLWTEQQLRQVSNTGTHSKHSAYQMADTLQLLTIRKESLLLVIEHHMLIQQQNCKQ